MSITTPPADWCEPPHGAEKMWIGLSLVWCIVLSIAMPYWHLKGKQTSSGEAYKVAPGDFNTRVEKFVQANRTGVMELTFPHRAPEKVPVCEPAPGSDIYLIGRAWRWYPVLKLKKGVEYRLHVSSLDFQHGLSVQGEQGLNMNFHVLPGYDHVLRITPTTTGEFIIICNEFCGGEHADMRGKIIVE